MIARIKWALLPKRPTEPQQWITASAIETFQQVREIADPRSVVARKKPTADEAERTAADWLGIRAGPLLASEVSQFICAHE